MKGGIMETRSVALTFKMYLSRTKLADNSVEIKSRAVRYFIEAFGDIDVEDVDYGIAEDYVNILTKGRSAGSVNTYLQNIKPFFEWLVKRGFIKVNPFGLIKKLQTMELKRDLYTADEIERMLLISDKRWQVIIMLALCSLRRSEILNLCVKDLRFDKSYITITPKADTNLTWLWDLKNHQQAIAPMPEIFRFPNIELNLHQGLIDLLDEVGSIQPYIVLPPKHYLRLMVKKKSGTLTYQDRLLPWSNFNRDFHHVLRQAKVESREFRNFRAGFATNIINSGMNPKETQRLMRHSSIETTMRYYVRVEEQNLIQKSLNVVSKYYMSTVP
jgi:integrase